MPRAFQREKKTSDTSEVLYIGYEKDIFAVCNKDSNSNTKSRRRRVYHQAAGKCTLARDEIYFKNDIRVELQALGGGPYDILKDAIVENAPLTPAYYGANGVLNLIHKKGFDGELNGWVNFFRQDHYRTVAYYYIVK